jgi:putative cell wall-binding protein
MGSKKEEGEKMEDTEENRHTCTNCKKHNAYLMFPYKIENQRLKVKYVVGSCDYIYICKYCRNIGTVQLIHEKTQNTEEKRKKCTICQSPLEGKIERGLRQCSTCFIKNVREKSEEEKRNREERKSKKSPFKRDKKEGKSN